MATDQKSPPVVDEEALAPSAIENEIPSYRAITRYAIFSVLCGIISSFSFGSLFFLAFSVGAVILGVLAHRAIKQYPDMYTGRGLANLGITLGLTFGLAISTYTGVQYVVLRLSAEHFGEEYAKVLTDGNLGDALWYGMYPEAKKDKTPAQALRDHEKAKAKERMFMDQKLAPLQNLKKRLASTSGTHLHFVDIEEQGIDETGGRIVYFATALYKIEGDGKDSPGTQHALAIFKGMPKGRKYEWWVDDVRFPYELKTFKAADKPVDDGHGHPH